MEEELTVEQMIPGLEQLSMYYNQTFLSTCNTCDSMNHKNPTSPLSNTLQGNRYRGDTDKKLTNP